MGKWNNIYEYLLYKVEDWDLVRIKVEFLDLARQTDPDTLTDLYQADMENDSYFEELTG
jgi:hypothetical protein